jgi:hypothetical protein
MFDPGGSPKYNTELRIKRHTHASLNIFSRCVGGEPRINSFILQGYQSMLREVTHIVDYSAKGVDHVV